MLKFICVPFLFYLVTFLTSFSADNFSVKGKISNLKENQKYIYLYQFFGSEAYKIDSCKLSKGNFSFKNIYLNGFYKLGFSSSNFAVIILNKAQEINFTANAEDILSSAKINNSIDNELFSSFVSFNSSYGSNLKNIAQQKSQIEMLAMNDTAKYFKLKAELKRKEDSLTIAQNDFFTNIASKYPETFMGKFSSIFVFTDSTNQNNYISQREFKDPEFTVGEMLVGKVNNYFAYFVPKNETDFIKAGKDLINQTESNSLNRELMYRIIINLYYKVGIKNNISEFRKSYAKEFPNSVRVKKYLNDLPQESPEIGDIAPDIFLPDTSGNFVKLSNIKAKVIILDFWASWCRPCRMENPNVLRVYNKFKSQGLEILGISLDEKQNAWKNAILKDALTWQHVSDLRGWSSIAGAAYGIKSIPSTFIINDKGEIIAKNLRGEALENFLQNYFSKQ